MPNTHGTTNANVIAQKALKTLLARLPFLKAISTDFSAENARFGASVIVHDVAYADAELFDPGEGYKPQGREQADITVTINKHIHHTYEVTVQEASASQVDLINRYAETAAYSIGAHVVDSLCRLVTKGNFANQTAVPLGAGGDGFDRKAIIRIGRDLSRRKVHPFGRFALLNPDYYASLCLDTSMLQVMLQGGAQVVQSGALPEIHGIQPMEYVDLPDNNQDLVGFAGISSALALATRIPDDPGEGQASARITTVTDPDTGLSLQVREWYNPDMGAYRRTYTLMYGVAAGQKAALQRIVGTVAPGNPAPPPAP